MAWSNPSDPVGSTTITVAYAIANMLNPIRWLRQMTGNADPPGSNYVVVSDSITGTTWKKVPTDALADLAVATGKLANGAVTNDKVALNAIAAANIVDSNVTTAKIAIGAVGNDQLALGAVGTNQMGDGSVTTAKLANTSVTQGKLAAASVSPDRLIAIDSPADNEIPTYDSATGNFEWQAASALVAAAVSVPSGLIAAFATAAAIASGWNRLDGNGGRPNFNGRMLVGAGTTFTVTFAETVAYGASWSHGHTGGGHTHNASALGVSGSTGGPSAQDGRGSGGTNTPHTDHSHNQGTIDVTGTTDSGGSVSTSSDAWVIPSVAVVWAQKS